MSLLPLPSRPGAWLEGPTPLPPVETVPDVEAQLEPADYQLLRDLLAQLRAKRHRNRLRIDYYEMRTLFQDLGIAIPPQLRNLEVAMGWPAKAVDVLARRVKLEGFVLPGGDPDDWGVGVIWSENRMEVEAPEAITSALITPPAFLSTTLGDTAAGEPEVLITMADAMNSTGIWNPARRGLAGALQILAGDQWGPTRIILLTPVWAIGMTRVDDGTVRRWEVRGTAHGIGRVPVEPLVYRPTLGRPFGSSRISRAVMSITDSAMRTVVRAEVGAEFYSAPQRYLMGADEEMFEGPDGQKKSTWDLVMGRILSAPAVRDEETGEVLPAPTVGQFPQISMQPHGDQMRMWASLMSGETGLSMSQLGVVQDNPSSAEAIYAAKEDLVIEAEACGTGFGPAFVRSMLTGIQMRDNLPAVPEELRGLGVRWRDPSTPSRAQATDAVMKQVQAGVLPAASDVALEALGYDDTTIRRIAADRRRANGQGVLQALQAAASGVTSGGPGGSPTA